MILLHIAVCFGIASILMLWMRSDLPVSITKILRLCGWKKHDAAFWPEKTEYMFWIRTQWAKWVALRSGTSGTAVRLFAHLITCPFCICAHLSWMAGLGVGFLVGWEQALMTPAYPAASFIIFNLTKP